MSKGEVTKVEGGAVAKTASALPRGFEKTDLKKVSMPRVKLLQSNSPELEDADLGLRAGMLAHSLLLEQMPEKFVPIKFWDSQINFIPKEEGGGVACRALDGRVSETGISCSSCPNYAWEGDTPPVCTATINALILFEGYRLPVVVSFANTSYKFGRKFRDMALYGATEKGGDAFDFKYKLQSVKTTNTKGTFYVAQVKPGGKPTDTEKAAAEALFKQFSDVVIESEVDDVQPEPTTDGGDF